MAPLDGRWAPSRFHKELQRAIAFRAYISILRSGVKKKQTQESILERLYHQGETNEHGELVQEPLVDQAIKGEGQFQGLCDRHSYINIAASGERKHEERLVVQDCFSRSLTVRFVIGESFTRESLSLAKLSDNKKLVSGRTLREGAERAERNGRKAYEYALEFLDENCELPPGKTMEDYDNFVLTKMYQDFKGNEDSSGTVAGSMRPQDFIFDGWFAFRLYGPVVDENMVEYKTDVFSNPPDDLDIKEEDDDLDIKGPPVASAVAFSSVARKRLAVKGPFLPNMPENEKQHVMKIVLERVDCRGRLQQAEIESLQLKAQSIEKRMGMELQIALGVAKDDPEHESWKEYRSLQSELTECWNQIEQKHAENKKRDAYESEVVNEYLSTVTSKKFRFDPKPI
eukprot:CAMPEP_0172457092 /NCGR_PEP_ID=MMETSP1065-20121228/19826_1 /TAXON_ID=265537 /ORGANISM="Amphiprora paludosa, Strain CCMP125" /LENGTH=398 /DNA_ID=CAMNT_0013210583 /DNA_START=37 /DNA_END=1236 /DNA_ORIENTATION=-